MTSNFKEFKVESPSNESWDEHNAMTSTAVCVINISTIFYCPDIFHLFLQQFTETILYMLQDYLASIDATKHAGTDLK